MSGRTSWSLESALKIVGVIVTVGGLLLALGQFTISQSIEAQKPFLVKKLAWCEEAANTAAMISVRPRGELPGKETRFWELYWGVMGLVEKGDVNDAMINFGNRLNATSSGETNLNAGSKETNPTTGSKETNPKTVSGKADAKTGTEVKNLPELSLEIAHACRKELAADWSPIWSRK